MGLPVEVNNLMLGSLGGYTVGRSLRLRSSASAYLNRTFGTPTNNKIWTWSGWVKRGSSGSRQFLSSTNTTGGSNAFYFEYDSSDVINIGDYGASWTWRLTTTQVFRDFSAWYHLVLSVDTTQATASNRVKLYVNGVQVTAFSTATYPSQNSNPYWNSATYSNIGNLNGTSLYFDGYLAEVNFIDGQALTPSSFGETDSITGVWNPKKYSGTYGTNGFYLNFSDNSAATATTIGKDSSGNGNNWTPNNISVTAGTTYDSMIDSPTVSASSSNYAVLNPLFKNSSLSITNGNLSIPVQTISGTNYGAGGTIGVSSGKWYFEMQINASSASSNDSAVGICKPTDAITNTTTTLGGMIGFMLSLANGVSVNYGTTTAVTGLTSATTNLIQVALDVDAGKVWFGADGVWANSGNPSTGANATYSSGIAGNTWVPALYYWGAGTFSRSINANFGQRPFSYTSPTGFNALNTYNLPAPSIANGAQYMAATTYTGTGASNTISNAVNGVSFAPDFIWLKSRSGIADHALMNTVVGATLGLSSNNTGAEFNQSANFSSFNSNGFTVQGTSTSYNANGSTFVGWQWKGGGTGVTNNSGTITSTVSANTTAGFSIVTYTGTGANATVGHGLGVAPSMIIIKNRQAANSWVVYHVSTGNGNVLLLNLTNASTADSTAWNTTTPTSSVFSLGSGASADTNQTMGGGQHVAYCFSAVSGFSAFGKWTGNGSSDGPFVFTNFRPRYVMWKRTDVSGDGWWIVDSSRNTYNVATQLLFAQSSTSETAITTPIDFLSNGFKLRNGADSSINGSGGTYIYMAFAEVPYNFARAR